MRRFFLLRIVCLLAAWIGWQGLASAQDPAVSGTDAVAIQGVIRAQLDAFAADDAPRAFSYATPGIQGMFGTPDNFIAMVRKGYPVVYRPSSVVFLKPEADGGQVLQAVQMTDADGQLWIALYTMQRQPGGGWLTNGCRLGRSQGRVT